MTRDPRRRTFSRRALLRSVPLLAAIGPAAMSPKPGMAMAAVVATAASTAPTTPPMVPPIPAPSAALVPTSAFVGVPPGTCRVRLSSVIWVPPSDESAATQPNVMLREQGPCLGGAAHVLASTWTWGAGVAPGPRPLPGKNVASGKNAYRSLPPRGRGPGDTSRANSTGSRVLRTSRAGTPPRRAMATPYRRFPSSLTE